MKRIHDLDQRQPVETRRRCRSARWLLVPVLLLGVLLSAAGCEEGVDAIVGSEYPFTIWGFMNAGADTQFVRVFPIEDALIPEQGSIDAQVSSTDLTTGERREWTYEAVQFDSLIEGHIFWSPFRAEFEHHYSLEVMRSDGATSRVRVKVPSKVDFDINVDDNGSTIIPVELKGDIPNLIGLRVTYDAVNVPPKLAWPPEISVAGAVQVPVTISYENLARRSSAGWSIQIDMIRDFAVVHGVFEYNCLITPGEYSAPDVWLRKMAFSALVADSSWSPPGGVFDPNILAVPGTFSNVENGYGFFGAGQGIRYEWTPTLDVALSAGYYYVPQCDFLFAMEIPECMFPPEPCLIENPPDVWRTWLE